nr:hypothetical protein [Rhodopirellula sp.]
MGSANQPFGTLMWTTHRVVTSVGAMGIRRLNVSLEVPSSNSLSVYV